VYKKSLILAARNWSAQAPIAERNAPGKPLSQFGGNAEVEAYTINAAISKMSKYTEALNNRTHACQFQRVLGASEDFGSAPGQRIPKRAMIVVHTRKKVQFAGTASLLR